MAYEINWEQGGVHRRYWGITSDEEIMASVNEMGDNTRYNELRYVINDFSGCEDVTYTQEGTQLISALGVLAELANPELKIAIVANKPATDGLASTYMASSLNKLPTRTFNTLGEAREWLAAASA
jgi:hypothetical protein